MANFNEIVLDPRNELQLTQEAKVRTFELSQGVLNSQLEGDPLDVFIRTQAYTAAEFLFFVNQLPLAFALKFLEATGEEKALGNYAQATLQFTLISPRATDFRIPADFEVLGRSTRNNLSFFTKTDLVILAGQTSGSVDAIAAEIGEEYNLGSNQITQITRPLAFLKSVTNPKAAQGGRQPESDAAYLNRAVAKLRRRAPVSKSDYQEYAEEIMGYGSRAIAVGLLGADKVTQERGAVHLFLLDATTEPANTALQRAVESSVGARIQLGTRLYVSPMDLLLVECLITAKIEPGEDPEVVADNLWATYQEFLDPTQFPEGGAVYPDELSHQLRFAGGLSYIDSLQINRDVQPIAMPNLHTLPVPIGMGIKLIDSSGAVYDLLRGQGDTL